MLKSAASFAQYYASATADTETLSFRQDEIEKLVRTVIESTLKDQTYDAEKVPHWINSICEESIQSLSSLRKPFKYAVTCIIAQRTGAAVHSANACYWDSVSDGALSVCWPKRNSRDPNNKSMFCIVTVFACSFLNDT